MLRAYPELTCWTEQHWFYIGLGTVGLVVYLVGLPCCIGLILYKIQTEKLHTNWKTLVAFGGLYTKYEAQAWWYEIIQILKRTIFVFLAVFDVRLHTDGQKPDKRTNNRPGAGPADS